MGENHALHSGSPRERDRPLGCIYKQNLVTQLWPLRRHRGVRGKGPGFLPVGRLSGPKKEAGDGKEEQIKRLNSGHRATPKASAELTGARHTPFPRLPPPYPIHPPLCVTFLFGSLRRLLGQNWGRLLHPSGIRLEEKPVSTTWFSTLNDKFSRPSVSNRRTLG